MKLYLKSELFTMIIEVSNESHVLISREVG